MAKPTKKKSSVKKPAARNARPPRKESVQRPVSKKVAKPTKAGKRGPSKKETTESPAVLLGLNHRERRKTIVEAVTRCSINHQGCPSDLINKRAGMFAIMTTGMIQPKIRRNSHGKIASG